MRPAACFSCDVVTDTRDVWFVFTDSGLLMCEGCYYNEYTDTDAVRQTAREYALWVKNGEGLDFLDR